ncbi:LysR family transcriptional regulator [Agrobacterium vitis]|uniref:LysR family transcriptional regulator n=1 Tax=Rhizobium/Agrobacterium group TaxID=227290 RepID=UPI0012E85F1B|nr:MULTISPECIES: LysR family transcriptional regulator [Rhizobium/Agrobacterium group]MCF1495749.1 LysR family transcriptional regulator [Allorhizobium ampelinum]MVA45816.1 LysR family transcriptional regulator [Agrobacterium vitis]
MISRNLRHLRLFAAVAELKSVTHTSQKWHLSQPAVTQAINKLERDSGGVLFERSRHGFFPTPLGETLLQRVNSAFALLDPALGDISPRLRMSLSYAQMQALIAVSEAENFTLAARRLGLAQPTVHRAITQIEQEAARSLFERTSFGILPTRLCLALALAARLAIYELDQADTELAEFYGGEAGSIVIGAMPLARSVLLPRALALFRRQRQTFPVRILDGPYDELLGALRRGVIDFLVGALRDPAPIGDVVQQRLFDDRLALLARPSHPLATKSPIELGDLLAYPWVVPHHGTPTRTQFETLFTSLGQAAPKRLIESGSLLLMRGLLQESLHLGCLSRHQAQPECEHGILVPLDYPTDHLIRPIGLTYRQNWRPTTVQSRMMELVAEVVPPED